MKRILFLIGLFFIASTLMIASQENIASIKRIIETRNGHKSCWGVVIQLKQLTFNKSINNNELSLIEEKHNSDLKDIMIWHVNKSRKKFVIKFKQGCGDFGSGNILDVTIKSSSFIESKKEDIKLSISTDEP